MGIDRGTNGSELTQANLDGLNGATTDDLDSLFTNWGWSNDDFPVLNTAPESYLGAQSREPILNPQPNSIIPGSNLSELPQQVNSSLDEHGTATLINQLADRIGSLRIGPGGQVRYDGATSNFNLIDMGAPDNLTVHRTVRHDGPIYLKRLDMGKEVSVELEDHLSNLYYTWQDPAFHVVKRDMFEKAKIKWRDDQQDTPYFSEALQNAVCSLGAAFESRHFPTFTTYPKSLADFFADRAKTLLEIELDTPCIATIQALVVLSGHDIGCKRDSRGWLYSGMATRLAFHLALHLDMEAYVSSKSMTQQEADLRRDVFWAAYTIDRIWSFHLGRAFRMDMESVTVGPPDAQKSLHPIGQWTPYVSIRSPPRQVPLPDPTVELHRQRVQLCEIMAPLSFALYGNLKMATDPLHRLNKLTVSKLLAWRENLPPALQVRIDSAEDLYLPHVILLHMSFYQNIIYCHRPWMPRCGSVPHEYLNDGHDPEHARGMCLEAAVSISKLLQIYEVHHGLRRIHIQAVGITCSAALLLIFAVVVNGSEEEDSSTPKSNNLPASSTGDAAGYLGICFNALDEFGYAWESAKKAKDFLNLLQKRWEMQARKIRQGQAVIPLKRQRGRRDSDAEPQPRRPWSGVPFSYDNVLDPMDINSDLGWIFMDSDPSSNRGVDLQRTASNNLS